MSANTTIAGVVALQGAFRLMELSLHLYSYLFPIQSTVNDKTKFDFIIVGAGSAGCVLATRLTDNVNVSVLLIEAGEDPTFEIMTPGLALYTRATKFDWNYTSINDGYGYQCYKNDGFKMIRGHGLGGTSGVNFMVYARGNPYDYNLWAQVVNDSSYTFENLLPYFNKGERLEDETTLNSKYAHLYGTQGEVGINKFPDPGKMKYLNALDEVGYKTVLDVNGNETLGFNFPMFTVSNGTRQSSCYCHLSPVRNRTNLYVLKNTKVTKILFNGTRAIGVKISSDSVTKNLYANSEVILSAGAFNTPQLLMLSGIGPTKHLKSLNITTLVNLPVGQNLQDHIGVFVAHNTDSYANATPSQFNPFKPALNAIIGYVPKNSSVNYPDIQFIMGNAKNPNAMRQFFAFTLNMDNDIAESAYNATSDREVFFNYILNMRPVSRGSVMLNSTDPNDPPKVYLGAYSNDTDLVKIINATKDYIIRIENSTYFKSVNAKRIDLTGDRCSSFDTDSDDYWRCYALCLTVSIYHYSSTCSMGSVVDTNLHVLGTTGLRVVDSSVYPITPSANINAPTMMLGEKASDMIKKYFNI